MSMSLIDHFWYFDYFKIASTQNDNKKCGETIDNFVSPETMSVR